jgi:ferric-dicitrate binding protein FerR (iron transport regulator)
MPDKEHDVTPLSGDDQFLLLALRYLDGLTTPEEDALLKAQLADSPGRREEFVSLASRHGMMAEIPVLNAEEATAAGGKLFRASRAFRVVALAASLAIIAGGYWFLNSKRVSPTSVVAMVQSADGRVEIARSGKTVPATAGAQILEQDMVVASSDGRAEIKYGTEETTVKLLAGTMAQFSLQNNAKQVRLDAGTLVCNVAKQPTGKAMRFVTPQASAVVVGTQLRLAVTNAATRLDVTEGRVQLVRIDQASVMVDAGEFAVASEGVELKAEPLKAVTNQQLRVTSSTNHFALRPDGYSSDSNFFPIGVWLQNPSDAEAYKMAGINTYVDIWEGPTEEDLSDLSAAGMTTICNQNRTGVKHINDGTIIGWMTYREPDDVQADGNGNFEPPINPADVIQRYGDLRANDVSRPVYLLLGMGAAWEAYPKLQKGGNYRDDYREYVRGCDIVSCHIYPVNETNSVIAGKLWYVPLGADNLHAFSGNTKPVWSWIECTKIHPDSAGKPTSAQVRSEVWMSLIHGANGIVYFCHAWTPVGEDDAALLHDPNMLAAVTDINRQITSLAPVLNSPTVSDGATAISSNTAVPIDVMVKKHSGATYIFAVAMRDGATTATFTVSAGDKVEVLGENRSLVVSGGKFTDGFESYGVHLYNLQ